MLSLLANAGANPIQWAELGLTPGIDLGFFTLRWYSLAYLAGILLGYWHLSKMVKSPGAPMAAFAVETVIDEMAERLEIDPIELRLHNAAQEGVRASFGPRFRRIGCVETLEAAREHPHYSAPLGPNQGRGVALGFWFNAGLQSSAGVNLNPDGSVSILSGNPDIGGSRASLAMMAAEEFGIDYDKVEVMVADTHSIGYTDVTGGSRVTFATGMAVIESSRRI